MKKYELISKKLINIDENGAVFLREKVYCNNCQYLNYRTYFINVCTNKNNLKIFDTALKHYELPNDIDNCNKNNDCKFFKSKFSLLKWVNILKKKRSYKMAKCNQCLKEMEYSQIIELEDTRAYLHFCTNAGCPSYGLLRI